MTNMLLSFWFLFLLLLTQHLNVYSQNWKYRKKDNSASEAGKHAPDFELRLLTSTRTVKLSDFRGKKPVVLLFGSFT